VGDLIAIDLDETGYAGSIREHARTLNTSVPQAVLELLVTAIEAELDRE